MMEIMQTTNVTAQEITEASAIPPEDLRLLFEGFDRINNTTNRYLAFYSLTASFLKNSEVNEKTTN